MARKWRTLLRVDRLRAASMPGFRSGQHPPLRRSESDPQRSRLKRNLFVVSLACTFNLSWIFLPHAPQWRDGGKNGSKASMCATWRMRGNTHTPALGAEDRPAMVVGWIEDPAKILTEVFRQLSEQDALSRILAIYNRELHSAASMEADIEGVQLCRQHLPAARGIGSIGVPRDQARLAPEVRHENVAAPSTPGIGYPKGKAAGRL